MRTCRRRIVVLLPILALPWLLRAETLRVGAEGGWQRVKIQGLREITLQGGGADAPALSLPGRKPCLSTASPSNQNGSVIDILLLAESDGIENFSSLYRIVGEIAQRLSARGGASIRLESNGIKLFPTPEAMWAAGREWGDFTLDFWLNPTNLNDGELLLLWKGRTAHGESQRLSARVENRKLVWNFEGLFRHGADRSLMIQLRSRPLVPGEWRHHRIRYKRNDSKSGLSGASPGLLEYLIDNIPTDSVHTTPTGTESSEVFIPKIGSLSKRPLLLAPDFNGYINEFRFTSTFDTNPVPENISNPDSVSFGAGYTDVIDSGYPRSEITALRADAPGKSRIRFFLHVVDNPDEARYVEFPSPDNPEWMEIRLERKEDTPLTLGGWRNWKVKHTISGRFFVVGYILEPDLGADISPSLFTLEIEYEPRLPLPGESGR